MTPAITGAVDGIIGVVDGFGLDLDEVTDILDTVRGPLNNVAASVKCILDNVDGILGDLLCKRDEAINELACCLLILVAEIAERFAKLAK